MLETYEPQEFKTIGILGGAYASEIWHIKDHFKQMARRLRESCEEETIVE